MATALTKTPPLVWLRAFEAVGRLGSFKAAALELNVSPSTISHQIRDLEAQLGALLFNRQAKPIEISAEGQALLPQLSAGFALINATFEAPLKRESELRIGSMPFLTNEVLLPKIAELKQALDCPQLSFRSETAVSALLHTSPQRRLDAVVRYTNGDPGPGLVALDLFAIELVPIQAAGKPVPTSTQALFAQPTIRILGPFDAWREWARQHNLDEDVHSTPEHVALETDNYHAATLAVARGDGMCLGVMPFMQPWLQAGKVQALERFRCATPYKASLVCAAHNQHNPALQRLHDWLVEYLC